MFPEVKLLMLIVFKQCCLEVPCSLRDGLALKSILKETQGPYSLSILISTGKLSRK